MVSSQSPFNFNLDFLTLLIPFLLTYLFTKNVTFILHQQCAMYDYSLLKDLKLHIQ